MRTCTVPARRSCSADRITVRPAGMPLGSRQTDAGQIPAESAAAVTPPGCSGAEPRRTATLETASPQLLSPASRKHHTKG